MAVNEPLSLPPMESLTVTSFTSLSPLQNHCNKPHITTSKTTFLLQNHFSLPKTTSHSLTPHFPIHSNNHNPILKITCTHLSKPLKITSFSRNSLKLQLSLALMAMGYPQFPCFATEITVPSDGVSSKINVESVLVSIDEFFNRYPFFVAGVTFIWLVVIPLTQEYLKKFKFLSALDAFRKLRDDPNSELLDIRDKKSVGYLGTPNLKVLKKSGIQIEFSEGQEERFVKKVLESFKDPGNTTVCVLDSFDGNSIIVAELLFKNGFKECYAVKGGIRGKDGWQAIQETLLPPSMHVFPKKGKTSKQLEMNKEDTNEKIQEPSSISEPAIKNKSTENGYVSSTGSPPQASPSSIRQSSPYPNYPDLKPPSSPTPSKPCKRLSFPKGVSCVARRLGIGENLRGLDVLESSRASLGIFTRLGGGIRANGVKFKENEAVRGTGDCVVAVALGKKIVLIELLLPGRVDAGTGSVFEVLKEIQTQGVEGIRTMAWIYDSIIVGTVNGYTLFSSSTGRNASMFSLPDPSSRPYLKSLWKNYEVLLLVDNVGIVVNAVGQPMGGSLVFRNAPESIGEISNYLIVVSDGKMELYHKKMGVRVQLVSFAGKGLGSCIVANEETGNGEYVVVATSSKVWVLYATRVSKFVMFSFDSKIS
ncbi:hypothetical protein GIB67_008469 [Kingdonia uniflora]|uniref:Rhodanese domain-containing protein n=1 Tax=Kingdonia uniflora TaxID=39325 RepID=A0A7J7N5Q5_9MAGN|nr:hypothetical protein GIB67_008469 [Kingdonia uniflora]